MTYQVSLRENILFSHVNFTSRKDIRCNEWLHDKWRLSQAAKKNFQVKWFDISLVFL